MIKAEKIEKAKRCLRQSWCKDGEKVIEVCSTIKPFKKSFDIFLKYHCVACGGNWGGMLLSGIKDLWPEVWDVIPDNMGWNAWSCICSVLTLCGVEMSD